MASIRKRKGKYEVQVRRKGFASACRNFHKKADAEEWARFMETRADRGELPTPLKTLDRHTVREILERYRDEISIKKRSYNTERHVIGSFLRQPIADYTLTKITFADFSSYQKKRLIAVKPGTVNRELFIIKHAFDIAMREWDIPLRENPLAKLKKLKTNNARTRRLSAEEYKTLEEAYSKNRNPHIMTLIRFAIETAMRRGEILRLKWDDINFEAKTLHIPLTKNGHARTIPLSREAIAILHELRSQNHDHGEQQQDNDLVFPVSDNAVKLSWQRLVDRAGIEDLHFHDLRHEAISRFFERGLSIPEVALISGHRDFKMLFRYTHLKPEDVARKLN